MHGLLYVSQLHGQIKLEQENVRKCILYNVIIATLSLCLYNDNEQ